MAVHSPLVAGWSTGTSTKPVAMHSSGNMGRVYAKAAHASGDVRAHYEDLEFTGIGGGEAFRVRAIANGLLCATGATINAAHFTGRVAAAKTVSGALNAVRATIEVAGTTPTPGGTLAALQLDSNIVTGWTAGTNDAFIRVGNTGAGLIANLFNITDASGTKSDTALVSTVHADEAATHGIRIMVNGTMMHLLATTASMAS